MDRNEFLRICFAKTLNECGIHRICNLDGYSEDMLCLVDDKSPFIVYDNHYDKHTKRKEKHFDSIIDAYHYMIHLACVDSFDYKVRKNYLMKTFWHYIYMDALKTIFEITTDVSIGSYCEEAFCFEQTVYGAYIVYVGEKGSKNQIKSFPASELKKACEYLITIYFDGNDDLSLEEAIKEFSYLTSSK